LDFNASEEVWKFFSRFDIDGLRTSSSLENSEVKSSLEIFPNPATSDIQIQFESIQKTDIRLVNLTGQTVFVASINSDFHQIDIAHLPEGVYFLKVGEEVKKILKSK